MFSSTMAIHVRRRAGKSVAADVADRLEVDRCTLFSGQDSDMNVQATGIALLGDCQIISVFVSGKALAAGSCRRITRG